MRTLGRIIVHAFHLASAALGDDIAGRTIRTSLLRRMGAHIGSDVTVHGGVYVTRPSNLRIGTGTFVNRNCYLDLEGVLTLGRNVTVGHGATFVTTHHELGTADHRCGASWGVPIDVGDGSWLGANVTILPGVVVGRGAIVGANALVVTDVPDNALVVGSPARVRRILS